MFWGGRALLAAVIWPPEVGTWPCHKGTCLCCSPREGWRAQGPETTYLGCVWPHVLAPVPWGWLPCSDSTSHGLCLHAWARSRFWRESLPFPNPWEVGGNTWPKTRATLMSWEGRAPVLWDTFNLWNITFQEATKIKAYLSWSTAVEKEITCPEISSALWEGKLTCFFCCFALVCFLMVSAFFLFCCDVS